MELDLVAVWVSTVSAPRHASMAATSPRVSFKPTPESRNRDR